MKENRDQDQQGQLDRDDRDRLMNGSGSQGTVWMAVATFMALVAAGGMLFYYNNRQRSTIDSLTARESDQNSTIAQLQAQVQDTTAKLNDISAQQAAAAEAAANPAKNSRGASGPSAAETNRLRQLQASLDEQKQQLQSTQDDVARTRSDLEGNLGSTRDELNGSIAKTHDELVLLEKRGERDYSEFDAARSKQFQRTGPLSISLRRSDPKHANVDLVVLVNDRQISKKKVNLYEPVWIYQDKDAQPVQVVVNKIDKDSIHGYVSAPKYSPADLAASASPADSDTNMSPASNSSNSTNSSNSPNSSDSDDNSNTE